MNQMGKNEFNWIKYDMLWGIMMVWFAMFNKITFKILLNKNDN